MRYRQIDLTGSYALPSPPSGGRRAIAFLQVMEFFWFMRFRERASIETIFVDGRNHKVPDEFLQKSYRSKRDISNPSEWWRRFSAKNRMDKRSAGSFLIAGSDWDNPEVSYIATIEYSSQRSGSVRLSFCISMFTRAHSWRESFQWLKPIMDRHNKFQEEFREFHSVLLDVKDDETITSSGVARQLALQTLKICRDAIDGFTIRLEQA